MVLFFLVNQRKTDALFPGRGCAKVMIRIFPAETPEDPARGTVPNQPLSTCMAIIPYPAGSLQGGRLTKDLPTIKHHR